MPQVRGAPFYPSALERGTRSEKALRLALAEMYVQGVSTSKVTKITEELCGCEISSSDVSRATKLLDEELTKWRHRPLGTVKYLILDVGGVCSFAAPMFDGYLASRAVDANGPSHLAQHFNPASKHAVISLPLPSQHTAL